MFTKLLEGIGAISTAESRKAMSWSRNYQDSVTAPLGRMFDDDVVGRDNEDEQDEVSFELDRSGSILAAVEKASIVISTLDNQLTMFHSFERLSVPYNQAHNANRVGSIKLLCHSMVNQASMGLNSHSC